MQYVVRGTPYAVCGTWLPRGTFFLALGFALQHISCSLQSRQRPQPNPSTHLQLPNPRTPDVYTPHQYWSANFIQLI